MSERNQLGWLLVLAVLGTYWTACAVVIARNLADHEQAPTPTTWFSGPGDLTEVTP